MPRAWGAAGSRPSSDGSSGRPLLLRLLLLLLLLRRRLLDPFPLRRLDPPARTGLLDPLDGEDRLDVLQAALVELVRPDDLQVEVLPVAVLLLDERPHIAFLGEREARVFADLEVAVPVLPDRPLPVKGGQLLEALPEARPDGADRGGVDVDPDIGPALRPLLLPVLLLGKREREERGAAAAGAASPFPRARARGGGTLLRPGARPA